MLGMNGGGAAAGARSFDNESCVNGCGHPVLVAGSDSQHFAVQGVAIVGSGGWAYTANSSGSAPTSARSNRGMLRLLPSRAPGGTSCRQIEIAPSVASPLIFPPHNLMGELVGANGVSVETSPVSYTHLTLPTILLV